MSFEKLFRNSNNPERPNLFLALESNEILEILGASLVGAKTIARCVTSATSAHKAGTVNHGANCVADPRMTH